MTRQIQNTKEEFKTTISSKGNAQTKDKHTNNAPNYSGKLKLTMQVQMNKSDFRLIQLMLKTLSSR